MILIGSLLLNSAGALRIFAARRLSTYISLRRLGVRDTCSYPFSSNIAVQSPKTRPCTRLAANVLLQRGNRLSIPQPAFTHSIPALGSGSSV